MSRHRARRKESVVHRSRRAWSPATAFSCRSATPRFRGRRRYRSSSGRCEAPSRTECARTPWRRRSRRREREATRRSARTRATVSVAWHLKLSAIESAPASVHRTKPLVRRIVVASLPPAAYVGRSEEVRVMVAKRVSVVLLCCAVSCATADRSPESRLVAAKAGLMAADYRADLATLAALRTEIAPLMDDPTLGYLASYWSGF